MSSQEIRMFNIQRGRDGEINYALLCNGRIHFVCKGGLNGYIDSDKYCNKKGCQESGSEVLNTSFLSSDDQEKLGLTSRVPQGMVLVTQANSRYGSRLSSRLYEGGQAVTPKQLEIGTLLSDGEGTTFMEKELGGLSVTWRSVIHYVRNINGKADEWRVGLAGRKRTDKKLAKLRRGERKSEVAYEVAYLNERMRELMQLHRTPEVEEEIENVKELLRLASHLSLEASFEAAEGNEQIARELASSRAREIGAEMQQIRERLMLEKRAREEAKEKLRELDQ